MVISSSRPLALLWPVLLVHLNSSHDLFWWGWEEVVSVFLSVFLFLLLDSLFPGRSLFSVSKCSTQKLYVLLLNSFHLRDGIFGCLLGMMKMVNLWKTELDLRITCYFPNELETLLEFNNSFTVKFSLGYSSWKDKNLLKLRALIDFLDRYWQY